MVGNFPAKPSVASIQSILLNMHFSMHIHDFLYVELIPFFISIINHHQYLSLIAFLTHQPRAIMAAKPIFSSFKQSLLD